MAIYFIGDMHLGHKNCLKFENRGFQNIDEHDEYMIRNWNETVSSDNDIVWVLGDVSWHTPERTGEILSQLKGRKNLCIGNHDERFLKKECFTKHFEEITSYKELRLDKKTAIVLCHYPILFFRNRHIGWYHFYAHLHNGPQEQKIQQFNRMICEEEGAQNRMINVGCMRPGFNLRPASFEQLVNMLNTSK